MAPDGDGEGDGEGTKRGGEGGAPGAKPQTLTGMLGQSQEGAPGRRLTRDESGVSQSAGLGGTGVPVRGSVYAGLPPPDLTEEALRRKDWEQPEPQPLGQWRQSLAASGVHPVHSADMMHQVPGGRGGRRCVYVCVWGVTFMIICVCQGGGARDGVGAGLYGCRRGKWHVPASLPPPGIVSQVLRLACTPQPQPHSHPHPHPHPHSCRSAAWTRTPSWRP